MKEDRFGWQGRLLKVYSASLLYTTIEIEKNEWGGVESLSEFFFSKADEKRDLTFLLSFRRISINYTLGSPECPWIHYFILISSFFLLFQMKNIEKIYFCRNEITIKHTLLTFIPAWVVSEGDFISHGWTARSLAVWSVEFLVRCLQDWQKGRRNNKPGKNNMTYGWTIISSGSYTFLPLLSFFLTLFPLGHHHLSLFFS